MAVSLRIPDDIKARVSQLAERVDATPHAFMVEAIREKVEAEEARLAFLGEAETRLARMKDSGLGIPAEDAFAYLGQRARGEPARRPRARKRP